MHLSQETLICSKAECSRFFPPFTSLFLWQEAAHTIVVTPECALHVQTVLLNLQGDATSKEDLTEEVQRQCCGSTESLRVTGLCAVCLRCLEHGERALK